MAFRNIRLHPVLRVIYFLIRTISSIGMSVFYRRRAVIGRENIVFDGPAIVISNHPSTLMDVLNVGVHIRQEMFFLANYGLFKHPVSNWILSRLYCIPVKRQEDVALGESRDNLAAFEQCFAHLEKNGILFIAPEGVSWMNRWVRPFKTGTARIALGMESKHAWQSGVKIIPVGLSYDHPNLFRSNVSVHFGDAITVTEWATAWEKDPKDASEQLTEILEEKVRSLSIDTQDEAGERVLTHWEKMMHTEQPLNPVKEYFRSKILSQKCLPNKELTGQTEIYLQKIRNANLEEDGLTLHLSPWWHWPMLIVGLPFLFLGLMCWYWPCKFILLLTQKLKLYIGYEPTIKVLSGLIFFPLWLWGTVALISYIGLLRAWPSSLIWLCLIALGLFVELWLDAWNMKRRKWKANTYKNVQPIEYEQIIRLRSNVLNALSSPIN
jgi:glycerol-3-phosphate O-acyltransferase / dihydroxyacetone phosphate acyltransferase